MPSHLNLAYQSADARSGHSTSALGSPTASSRTAICGWEGGAASSVRKKTVWRLGMMSVDEP